MALLLGSVTTLELNCSPRKVLATDLKATADILLRVSPARAKDGL